jgi:8-oxo-dGTP diphosphatase
VSGSGWRHIAQKTQITFAHEYGASTCETLDVFTPTLVTTAYILSPDRDSVLLIHRNKRPDDTHYGKYLGPGGHVEPDEDVVSCIRREIEEETSLIVLDLTMRGTVLWPGFSGPGNDEFGFVFRIERYRGEPNTDNEEGTLEWVRIDELDNVPMWTSDREWLPMVFDDDPRQFHGVMPYLDGEMVSWAYQRI